MTQQKLMLGDRVMYNGEPSVIVEVRRTCAQVEPSFDMVDDFDEFEPIPWTAEIAAKNGFEFEGGEYWLRCGALTIRTGNGYVAIVETYKNGVIQERVHIRQVCFHKFQHALRLVGLDDLADSLRL